MTFFEIDDSWILRSIFDKRYGHFIHQTATKKIYEHLVQIRKNVLSWKPLHPDLDDDLDVEYEFIILIDGIEIASRFTTETREINYIEKDLSDYMVNLKNLICGDKELTYIKSWINDVLVKYFADNIEKDHEKTFQQAKNSFDNCLKQLTS